MNPLRLDKLPFQLSVYDKYAKKELLQMLSKSAWSEVVRQRLPLLGTVEVVIDRPQIHELCFVEDTVQIDLSVDYWIKPMQRCTFIQVRGRLFIALAVQMQEIDREKPIVKIDIIDLHWEKGPFFKAFVEVNTGWLIQNFTDASLQRFERMINESLSNQLNWSIISGQLAQQAQVIPLWDDKGLMLTDADVGFTEIKISHGEALLSGSLSSKIEYMDISNPTQPNINVGVRTGESDLFWTAEIDILLINDWLNRNIDMINTQMPNRKMHLESCQISTEPERISIHVLFKDFSGSPIEVVLTPSIDATSQTCLLDNLAIHPDKGAGTMLKTLLFTFGGSLESFISRKFPLDLHPLKKRILQDIQEQFPEQMNIEATPMRIIELSWDEQILAIQFETLCVLQAGKEISAQD